MLIVDQNDVVPGAPALVGPILGAREPIRLILVGHDSIRRQTSHSTMYAHMIEDQIKTQPDVERPCFFDKLF
jgi:hypothetical protein